VFTSAATGEEFTGFLSAYRAIANNKTRMYSIEVDGVREFAGHGGAGQAFYLYSNLRYTGGGGGGSNASGSPRNGGAGGSGVVILRYPAFYEITIGAGLSGSTTVDGANRITTITAGTGNVSWA
jgi:hypothetical protein